jgi:hypothetical protein
MLYTPPPMWPSVGPYLEADNQWAYDNPDEWVEELLETEEILG